MSVLETATQLTEDIGDVNPFLCHIYDGLSEEIAKCGLPNEQDKHWQMHKGAREKYPWIPSVWLTSCPRCEAPICPACLKLTGGM